MCGIAGSYQFNNQGAALYNLENANLKQWLRGPDGGGLYQLDGLVLGHRRLKIFDLSDRAAQPMVDHALGLALVFNGAIYNFKELRKELEAKGYSFYSESDTEVLLKAYHAWGADCVSRIHGMFAFAVWERETGTLVIARDRMGIKPLYYANTADGFRFASTLPALLEFEGIDTSIDKAALHYYLTFHAVPEPRTILSGVRKLKPGSIMTVKSDGTTEVKPYWKLQVDENQANGSLDESQWLKATHDALLLATGRQLAADVPVGVLLSGGLDSSLLVALAAQMGGHKIETFSIGFEGANGEAGDEFIYSDKVVEHFGTSHHKMYISNKQLTHSMAQCVASMSEPMTSHDNIAFYLLSQEVAKHVKVVLSGQGADEMFAGYHWFHSIANDATTPEQSGRTILNTVADNTYEEYLQLVRPDFRTEDHAATFLEQMCRENATANTVDNLLVYEGTFALTNGPLERVDNMTMAASLEARVPFLDEVVVEAAMKMPLRYKMPDGGKYILKQLGRKILPREVVDRPKGYFPVPALRYPHGATLEFIRGVLSEENVRRRGMFEYKAINEMLEHPLNHTTALGASKLWQVGVLEYWLQQQGL
ncbi:MAG TPA: N-acetylglutaminylglutamine amidotransferase [Rickettsiales bacterium]|nr:N-acetylglutaminylglutamine amidotransferase [Rickettsiales bacterium]